MEELAQYRGKTWETCQTFSGSWGYYRDENSWKSTHQLLELLIGSVSKGGNLILNVRPHRPRPVPLPRTSALGNIGDWMKGNSESIYGCTYAPEAFENAQKHHAHLQSHHQKIVRTPAGNTTTASSYRNYKSKIKYAQLLHDNSEVKFTTDGNNITLTLPDKQPNVEIPVVELVLN